MAYLLDSNVCIQAKNLQYGVDGIVGSLRATREWSTRGAYEQGAVSTFLSVADYYLVAQAHAYQHTVVTHEVFAQTTRKINIPNACIGMGVRCITPSEMLRAEGVKLVLG
jgi:hypothetical protein